ncbi:ABC-2 type transporter [uncultured archaeon]|nr:ABC-2 type transporter [uncultured archaeon]
MNLRGVYAIWWREMIAFLRETPRLISAIVNPIVWLFIFGAGLGASVDVSGVDYQKFIFAGVLTQTFLFTSIFYGAYLVWDKRIDLLKSILVSPLSRATIFFGKVLGGVTISLMEALIVLVFGIFIGIPYTPASFLMSLLIVFIASAIFTSVGLTIGSMMESPEGFQLLSSFLLFPLFFLSGALFPLENLPGWLETVTAANPVTYVVDMLRGTLLGVQHFDTSHNLLLLGVFLAITSAVGVEAFKRMKS